MRKSTSILAICYSQDVVRQSKENEEWSIYQQDM